MFCAPEKKLQLLIFHLLQFLVSQHLQSNTVPEQDPQLATPTQASLLGSAAMQFWQLSSGSPYFSMNTRAQIGLPPLEHLPTPQFSNACTERIVWLRPLELLLSRSAIICTVANAQEELQGWGVTALRLGVRYAGSWYDILIGCFTEESLMLLSLGSVLFLTSLVQVSTGDAQAHLPSMPNTLAPLSTLKCPFSPQALPQEFFTLQNLVPLSTPQPQTSTQWLTLPPAAPLTTPPVQLTRFVASIPQAIGPQVKIS